MLFKHMLGRWSLVIADEAGSGQSKKTKNKSAKPGSKKGLRWWMSLCSATEWTDEDGNVRRRTTGFFYEKIKPLAYTAKNGSTKYKHRTKESLCWHIVRLAAWGAKCVTDCAKGYLPLGDYWRRGTLRIASHLLEVRSWFVPRNTQVCWVGSCCYGCGRWSHTLCCCLLAL